MRFHKMNWFRNYVSIVKLIKKKHVAFNNKSIVIENE